MRIVSLIAATCLVFVTGCATTQKDAYTDEEKTSSEVKGTAIGGVTGAVIGSQVGKKKDRGRNAIIGAAVGGLIGNRIGASLDRQEEELRRELRGTGVSVTRKGNQINLNMPGNITFETGKSQVKQRFTPVLNSVAKVLKKYDDTNIEVGGHTDSVGSASDNQLLSEQRARSVSHYLRRKGVSSKRLAAVGYGESQPIAANSNSSGRSKNRRVELQLFPKK